MITDKAGIFADPAVVFEIQCFLVPWTDQATGTEQSVVMLIFQTC